MPQPYFVKGLIGKVLAYGGLQIRKYIPHGLQIPADKITPCKALRDCFVGCSYSVGYSLLFIEEPCELSFRKC